MILKILTEARKRIDEENKQKKEALDRVRELNGKTYFLIAYDFKNNNGTIKKELTANHKFIDKKREQPLPDTTLLWKGSSTDTRESCLEKFKTIVRTIIKGKELDTEIDKVIVVEIFEPALFFVEE